MTEAPPTPLTRRLAENLRAELARRRITVVALAEQTGIDERTLRRRLAGDPPGFSVAELVGIAAALDVDPAELLRGAR